MLDIISQKNPEKVAIFYDGSTKTYFQLKKDILEIKEFFRSGQVVILLCNNSYYSLLFYLTCLHVGSIPLLLSDNISEIQIDQYIRRYCPSLILSPRKLNIEINNPMNIGDYYIYFKNKDKFVDNKNLILLLTTSGSTGSPKVVKVTNENLISNTKSICKYLNLNNNDRHITTLPMNYTYGLSCINTFLYSGGSIIVNNHAISTKEFWTNVEQLKPNYLSGVPYTYEILSKYFFKKLIDSSFQVFTQAGGKLSNRVVRKFLEFSKENNKKFIVMYGQTEATARMSYLPFNKLQEKIGSIGIAIPGGEFSLRNTFLEDNSKNKLLGELVYSGKNVTEGYANSFRELHKKGINPKTLNTGDIAWIDEDRFVYLVGRINRYAKINGIRVSLLDVEDMIKEIGYNAAILSDDISLEIYIESNIQNKEILINIKKEIAAKINISPTSIKLKSMYQLPRLDSGKINYKLIEK